MMQRIFIIFLSWLFTNCFAQQTPKPTAAQLTWHKQQFYLFMHFGPNTFTNVEWGHGNEKSEIFNPTNLDCEQWCKTAVAAGAKGIIITAKHHDGFCLWPSKYSKHTVKESDWKNGNGDVLKELSVACKKYGLKFGVYISPWDRNHTDYGTEKYNEVFVNMMTELFTNYGPIWELWWDGANGEGPNGKKQIYDWERYKSVVKKLSPNTVVFSDIGPHIRWVGNEEGIAGSTNWNYLDTIGFTPGSGAPKQDTLTIGNVNGKAWIPAECDVSIRPGWFYHESENDKVKTPLQLMQIYMKSVGHGANLLLNVPPDNRGLIHVNDSLALVGFKKMRDGNFGKKIEVNVITVSNKIDWTSTKKLTDGKYGTYVNIGAHTDISIHNTNKKEFNCIVFEEYLNEGQSINEVEIFYFDENKKKKIIASATTVGKQRIITFPPIKTANFQISVSGKYGVGVPKLTEIGVFKIDETLISSPQ